MFFSEVSWTFVFGSFSLIYISLQQTSFALVYTLQKMTTPFQALHGFTAPRINEVSLSQGKSFYCCSFGQISTSVSLESV